MIMLSISLMSVNYYSEKIDFDDPEHEICEGEAIDFAVVLINIGGYTDEMFDQLVNMTYDVCMEAYEEKLTVVFP